MLSAEFILAFSIAGPLTPPHPQEGGCGGGKLSPIEVYHARRESEFTKFISLENYLDLLGFLPSEPPIPRD